MAWRSNSIVSTTCAPRTARAGNVWVLTITAATARSLALAAGQGLDPRLRSGPRARPGPVGVADRHQQDDIAAVHTALRPRADRLAG